jgi:hypothetical protein
MFVDADITDTAPEAPAADAWSERKLAILSELAEAGLEIALALKGRIIETTNLEPDPAAVGEYADLARAFDRVSRAVRLSIALRDKLLNAADSRPGRDTTQETRNERAGRVRRIVRRVAKADFKDGLLLEAVDRHVGERLNDRDITGDLLGRPIGELVAKICADLGLMPRWRELAEEAWAQAEIAERPPGSPYAAWPALPPEEPDPDDPDPWDPAFWDPKGDLEDEDEEDDPGGDDP